MSSEEIDRMKSKKSIGSKSSRVKQHCELSNNSNASLTQLDFKAQEAKQPTATAQLAALSEPKKFLSSSSLKHTSTTNTRAAAHTCSGCNKLIKREKYLLRACDKFWHESCLKCDQCHAKLGELGSSLFVKSDLILCRQDFLDLFGPSCVCAVCEKLIRASEMVMRAKHNVYHLDCFACQLCNQRFCVGDQFYLLENKVICQYDYEDIQRSVQSIDHHQLTASPPIGLNLFAVNNGGNIVHSQTTSSDHFREDEHHHQSYSPMNQHGEPASILQELTAAAAPGRNKQHNPSPPVFNQLMDCGQEEVSEAPPVGDGDQEEFEDENDELATLATAATATDSTSRANEGTPIVNELE